MGLIIPDGLERIYLAQRSEPRSAGAYAAACEFDVAAMKPYLLEGDLIDIGCGLGGPSVLVARLCGGKLHLVDGTAWGARKTGFAPSMEPYNDREATETLLVANGIRDYQWWPVGTAQLPSARNVVSLISWGWHYPVSTYIQAVEQALPVGGRLILDLRSGTDGEQSLARSFAFVAAYQGFGKCNKTVWERR